MQACARWVAGRPAWVVTEKPDLSARGQDGGGGEGGRGQDGGGGEGGEGRPWGGGRGVEDRRDGGGRPDTSVCGDLPSVARGA